MAKTDIKHLDKCPKKRVEPMTRQFVRKGDWFKSKGWRCADCGQASMSKPKKFDPKDE